MTPDTATPSQIQLWEADPGRALTEVQDAALAYLAEGVRACYPRNIRTAETLLRRLVAAADTASPSELVGAARLPASGVADTLHVPCACLGEWHS